MTRARGGFFAITALLLAALPLGCSKGSGSDIGPKLAPGPTYDYRVLVHDDTGKPIVGAKISVSGTATTAVTGRTGRAFLSEPIVGTRRLTVDGSQAAATDQSRLGTCTVAAAMPDGDELPYVLYLPDHGPSLGLTLSTGVQAGTGLLDDDDATVTTRSGARLTVNTGDTVTFGAAANVELRTGRLSVGHLPRTLAEGGTTTLASRAVYIHPAGVQFATGATLSIPDDLGLAAAETVDVYWLDPATGRWTRIGSGGESSGRIVAAPPLAPIRNGGFYSFGKPAIATTVISGRVLDENKFPIPGALVRGPQASTRTGFDGRFTLPAVSRTDNTGANRDLTLQIHGGRNYLPTGLTVQIDKADLSGATHTLASVELKTSPATNLRLLLLNRGKTVPNRRFCVSTRTALSDASGVIDAGGMVRFEEIAAEVVGFLESIPRDIEAVYRARNLLVLRPGLDNATNIFATEIPWRWAPIGGTLIEAVDKAGTGALHLAHVVRGDVPGVGFLGLTDLNGYFGLGVLPTDSLTTVIKTELEGRTVTSAFTAEEPDIGRIETPLERAPRQYALFDRFGVFTGDLTGVAASTTKTRRVRTTGSMTHQDFVDLAAFGRPRRGSPAFVMPTSTSATYRYGVPAGTGHLAAAEGSMASGSFQIERLGVVLGVTSVEGAQTARDIPLTVIPGSSPFRIQSGLLNLDPGFVTTDLRFHVAGDLGKGLLVDLAADVGIDPTHISGNDVTLPLPPRPAGIQQYWAVVGGVRIAAGVTSKQCVLAPLHEAAVPTVAQLALPVITSPLPGAIVPKAGFPIQFTLPPECHYAVVQVRSEKTTGGKTDVRDWTVVVPRDRTQADFFSFQAPVPPVLVDGEDRTWTLTVTAGRVDTGSLIDPRLEYRRTYVRILANWTGMKEFDRGARAFSSVSQTFETRQ